MSRELSGTVNHKENNIKMRQSKIHIKRHYLALYNPVIPQPATYRREMKTQRPVGNCSYSILNSQKLETTQCPSTGKWIDKV